MIWIDPADVSPAAIASAHTAWLARERARLRCRPNLPEPEPRRKIAAPVRVTIFDHPVRRIQKIVAAHYGMEVADLCGRRRTAGGHPSAGLPSVVWPRHVAMFLASRITGCSLPDIGRRFGGRDHTTVLSGVRKVAARIADDPAFEAEVEALARRAS